jgi:hypothetical protein
MKVSLSYITGFGTNRLRYENTAEEINRALGLAGDYAVKPDLPCLSIGSRSGLVYLFVNPGWKRDANAKEDAFCRRSKDNYIDLMFNFFITYPKVVGQRNNFGVNMISFVGLLRDGLQRFGRPKTAPEKWRLAHELKLIGHWELFPFHSSSDGLTQHIHQQPWLSLCMREAVAAIVRLQPELLVVMSRFGWNILRNDVLVNNRWKDTEIGNPATRLSYCMIKGKTRKTEIVAIPRQVFSSHRICTNHEFFSAVDALRLNYSNQLPDHNKIQSPPSQPATEFLERKVIRIPRAKAGGNTAQPELLNSNAVGFLSKARPGTARYLITFTRTKDGEIQTVQMAWREYSPELAVQKTFGHWEKRGYRCDGPQNVSLIEGSEA